MNNEKPAKSKPNLLKVAVYTLPACLIILALFYYWFAMADQNEVFLYFHMPPRVPDTSPFSFVTASRYWMSGPVACGIVLLVYFPASFILFWAKNNYICKTGTNGEDSAGIGLMLTKDFLDKNNAKVEIASSPGAGTRFTIRF